MKILFVTDLHGIRWKYDRLLELAKHHGITALVNGGDMLPKEGNLFRQDQFIAGYLQIYRKEPALAHAPRSHPRIAADDSKVVCGSGSDFLYPARTAR